MNFTPDNDDPAKMKIMKAVNDTLDSIEAILYTKSFCGQIQQFYTLIDACYLYRPVSALDIYKYILKIIMTC